MRVYRASSLGYSLEALVAPHLGYEAIGPPEFLQVAFDEGNRIEPLCLEKLRGIVGDGFIDGEQREVELEVIPGVAKVVGHLDGVLHYQDRSGRVVEVKSMNGKTWKQVKDRGFAAGGIMDKYAWQISAYMLATGLGGLMVFWNKDTEELHLLEVNEPPRTISDIANKLAAAESHIAAGTIPEGCTDFPCSFFFLHAPSDNPVVDADEELNWLMGEWLSLDNHEKAFKKEKDQVREQILGLAVAEAAGNIRGSNGVTMVTTWQEEKEYTTKRKAGWVTRISGPRKGQSATK